MNENGDDYSKYAEKLKEMESSWAITYQNITKDFNFVSGGRFMWGDSIYNARSTKARPIVSINLTTPYVDRIVAPCRMHPPGMAIRTEDQGIQKLVNGILRGIEKSSSSTDAYASALNSAVICGMGWLYLAVVEENGELNLRIKSTTDPTLMMIDPMSFNLDGSDAKYAVYRGFISKDEAKKFGADATKRGVEVGKSGMFYNVPDNAVMDCIWYTIEGDGMRITRTIGEQEVYNQLFQGVKFLPVVPVIGDTIYSSDGCRYSGIVRKTRDLNTSVNIIASNVMELVALAPKSPWIGAAEGFKGHNDTWATSNTEPHAYIPFNHKDKDGTPIPMPTRMDNTAQTQGLQMVGEWMQGMMSRVTGVSDAMLGGLESANEAGRSLIARMEASEHATAQYIDHLTTSITQLARALIQMMPIIYVGERRLYLIDQNGKSSRITGDLSEALTQDVISMIDVEIGTGPQMEMRKKASNVALQNIIMGLGEKGVMMMDILAKTEDFEDQDLIQSRLKKILPPEIFDDESQADEDPRAAQILQEMSDIIDQKELALQSAEGIIQQQQNQINSTTEFTEVELRKAQISTETSILKAQMEIDARKEIEFIKQGSENARLASKLSADQQKHITDIITKMAEDNAKIINESHEMNENSDGYQSKLPKFIQKEFIEAKQNENES